MTMLDTNVVLVSPKFLPELNKLPDSMVSFDAAVDEVSKSAHNRSKSSALKDGDRRLTFCACEKSMETKYTKIQSSVPIIPHIIKGKLTPSLSKSYNQNKT